MTILEQSGWLALEQRIAGDVILPGDERMRIANKQYAAGKPLPVAQALLRCRSADDVRRCLAFLRERGIGFSVRSGGHCFADHSSCDGAIIDLSGIDFCLQHDDGIRVGPGLLAADLVPALARVGRAIPTGGCPWVAIGGLSLAGGFGFLGRSTGLVVDQIVEIEVMTADGELLVCNAGNESELFWAMRGAGTAGLGIATSLTLRTVPFPEFAMCYGAWPISEAADLIALWQHRCAAADGRINIELGLIGSDHPDEPAFVKLYGIIVGDEAQVEDDLRSLRDALGVLSSGLRSWRADRKTSAGFLAGLVDHQGKLAWQPSRPYQHCGYQFQHSDFFELEHGRGAIDECVRNFDLDRRYAQFRELEFIPWGGAYAAVDESACFLHRAPRMMVRHAVMLGARSDDALRRDSQGWVDASRATLSQHVSGHVYQGYADQHLSDWQHAYYGDAYARLQRIKQRYDPQNVFRHAQSIRPPSF